MSHIAKDDRAYMKRHDLIHSLYDEIENKVKTLSHEVKENPGLRPILDRYIEHIKSRQDEARALQEYFHFLLQSLYTVDKSRSRPGPGPEDEQHKQHKKHSSKIIKQMQVDEKAILFELDKWKGKAHTYNGVI